MYEIESVMMDNDGSVDEEYLDESELLQSSQEPKQESPPKRKIPIIRRPGEVVTPVNNRRQGPVKVSPSIYTSNSTAPRVTPSGRTKNTWYQVPPYSTNVPLKPVKTSAPVKRIMLSQRVEQARCEDDGMADDDDGGQNGFEAHNYQIKQEPSSSISKVTLETLDAKLDALDHKLNKIVARLGEQDGALKAVKINIKDLRYELTTIRSSSYSAHNSRHEERTPNRRRQPQVLFPVTDDNYLLRLEELVQADNEIREELFERFLEAGGLSVVSYMRKNIRYLFNNTSKYTWTGRPSNSHKDAEPSGVASQLTLVSVLVDSACEKFACGNRDDIEQEFRRSLQRFNEAKFLKRRKRVLEKLATAASRDEEEEGEGEEDGE